MQPEAVRRDARRRKKRASVPPVLIEGRGLAARHRIPAVRDRLGQRRVEQRERALAPLALDVDRAGEVAEGLAEAQTPRLGVSGIAGCRPGYSMRSGSVDLAAAADPSARTSCAAPRGLGHGEIVQPERGVPDGLGDAAVTSGSRPSAVAMTAATRRGSPPRAGSRRWRATTRAAVTSALSVNGPAVPRRALDDHAPPVAALLADAGAEDRARRGRDRHAAALGDHECAADGVGLPLRPGGRRRSGRRLLVGHREVIERAARLRERLRARSRVATAIVDVFAVDGAEARTMPMMSSPPNGSRSSPGRVHRHHVGVAHQGEASAPSDRCPGCRVAAGVRVSRRALGGEAEPAKKSSRASTLLSVAEAWCRR